MAFYPNNYRSGVGMNPLYRYGGLFALFNPIQGKGRNIGRYTGLFPAAAGYPDGYDKSPGMPLKAGSMTSLTPTIANVSWNAGLLAGGPMTGTAQVLTMSGAADLSLIVSLTGSGPVMTFSTPTVNLSLTISLSGTGSIVFTPTAPNLSMIVPFEGTAQILALSGSLDLRGRLALTGSFSSVTELSPENLAAAVWNSILTSYPTVGSAGDTLRLAGIGGSGGGLTPAQEALLDLLRAAVAGKAIINPAGTQIDLYAEDGVTILRSLSVSPDLKTRTPI